jgi:hypothetical protein
MLAPTRASHGWCRLKQDNVKGIVINDRQGLPLKVSGDVPKHTGAVTELFRNAQQLEPSATDSPVITIETELRRVVITGAEGGGAVAVFSAAEIQE